MYYWDETQTESNKTLVIQSENNKNIYKINKLNFTLFVKCEVSTLDPQNYIVDANGVFKKNVCYKLFKLHFVYNL